MQITTSDIQLAKAFSEALSEACDEMFEGEPVSRALVHHSVSPSTFSTLIRGLRKSNAEKVPDADDIESLRRPAWQDDLVYDLCGEKYVYIPQDFDEAFTAIENKTLEPSEKTIINLYYRQHQTTQQIAAHLGIDETNVRVKKNQALMKLREYTDDLLVGKDYLDHLGEMKQQYRKHQSELSWMKSAIEFMNDIDPEFDKEISENDELTDDEKKFFTEHHVRKLRNLIGVDMSELLTEFVEATEGYAASLIEKIPDEKDGAKVRQNSGRDQVFPDTSLEELDFRDRTLEAFHRQGLYTAGDVFSLDERKVRSLTGIGEKQIIHLCWQALHGIEKKGNRDDEEDD